MAVVETLIRYGRQHEAKRLFVLAVQNEVNAAKKAGETREQAFTGRTVLRLNRRLAERIWDNT